MRLPLLRGPLRTPRSASAGRRSPRGPKPRGSASSGRVRAAALAVASLAGLVAACSDSTTAITAGLATSEACADGARLGRLEQRLELLPPEAELPIALPESSDPLLADLVIPRDAASRGMWSPVADWPLNGLHSVLLPTGEVLTFGTPQGNAADQDGRTFDVWDPAQGLSAASHRTRFEPQQVNSFCSSAAFLPDGSLLVSGGNDPLDSSLLSPKTGVVATSPFRMASDRWYGTMITLADGRFLMMGGSQPYDALRAYQDPGQAINAGTVSMTPELYEPGAGFRSLFGATSREAFGPDHHRYWYPRAWVAPSGEVFGISSEKMWYLDPTGGGSVRVVGDFKQGANAAARPNIGPTSTAVMFAPGRILQVGGNGYHDGHATPASALATVVDIQGGEPVVQETAPLRFPRHWANATVLPDGKVAVTGGTRFANNGAADAVYEAELWDPQSGEWALGAAAGIVRVYHSAAILMPNGAVLSTGGGAPGPVNNLNAELYYPPYLFRETPGGGPELAPRPRVARASTLEPRYGDDVNLELAESAPIERAVLIATGSVTHSFNSSQRRLELPLLQAGARLAVEMPRSGFEAPPGYYLLFLLDAGGVPSRGVTLSLGVAGIEPPVELPRDTAVTLRSVSQPGYALAAEAGAPAELTLLGSAPSSQQALPATFLLRPGLADASCISAESAASPGHFLRHYAYRIQLDEEEASALFRADATFCPESSASGSGVRFRSKNFPERVLRSVGDELWIDPESAEGGFAEQTSFLVELAPAPELPPVEAPIVAAGSEATYAPADIGLPGTYEWSFGDGSEPIASPEPGAGHTFEAPGVYLVTWSVRLADGRTATRTFVQGVRGPLEAEAPRTSSQVALTDAPGGGRLWVVNPDGGSLTGIDSDSLARVVEVPVCAAPRSVAEAPSGLLWVSCRDESAIAVFDPSARAVARKLPLPAASRPYGLVFAPGGNAYVALDALGSVAELDAETGELLGSVAVGPTPRGLSVTADGARLLVSRFVSPPAPGEATASVSTASAHGELRILDLPAPAAGRLVALGHSDRTDSSVQARGMVNYLGAAAISPDGRTAWVPSKQDNVARGVLRDGQPLDFQSTVRAVLSRVDLTEEAERLEARVDLDDSGVASAALHHPSGVYLFAALETSREVAVLSATSGTELFRIEVGLAPQALALSGDGARLFVHNFMGRSVTVIDLTPLVRRGRFEARALATVTTVAEERLSAAVLLGKQLFYDARDPRLARDGYLSCASCHAEGGDDGRVWDLTGKGEGLRNTISLVGRGGSPGLLHWSGNFDEVQDFEAQIRSLGGGSGLLADNLLQSGSVADPLGEPKAGLSADLDALAAYVGSLTAIAQSPYREGEGSAAAGRQLFGNLGCNGCHYGSTFSDEARSARADIGTLKPSSGQRLSGPLSGIDVPPLSGAWSTPPYLHDGSAATLEEAIAAHASLSLTAEELSELAGFVRQIDGREAALNPAGCTDGFENGEESDVDCGGPCTPCELGAACAVDADCDAALCMGGRCQAPPSCSDGLPNQGEADVDCGGPCTPCPLASVCSADADCQSGLCASGACEAPPSCTDGAHNQGEADVDCGGPCTPCPLASACSADADCQSGLCASGACEVPPSCTDGLLNQSEADVDCGGPCPPCALGAACGADGDCEAGRCGAGRCEAPASCADEQRNQGESDVDCGGPCAPCRLGAHCAADADCAVGACTQGTCRARATCGDGLRNQGESGLDCGGPCAPCGSGGRCAIASECASGLCANGTCQARATCDDGLRNQGERGVDCGGPCPACELPPGCPPPPEAR